MNQISTSALAATLVFTCAGVARADCAPVLAAYSKADATKRFAMFDVDSLDAPPKGEPFMVSIGDSAYVPNIVKKGPLNYVKEGYTKSPSTFVGSEAASLKSREQKGAVRCEPLGERKIGAMLAVGYQIRRNDKGTQPDDTAIHMWISRESGLPIYHGMGSDGGLRWVYGAAVTAPAVAQSKP